MFFNTRRQDLLGSRCPLSSSMVSLKMEDQSQNPSSNIRSQIIPNGPSMTLRPKVKVNTYLLHKALYDVAQDELVSSVVLQYYF